MKVDVINQNLSIDAYGFSGTANNKNYTETAFALMSKMWQTVKSNNLANKGLNVWVFEQYHRVFAGVELTEILKNEGELELNEIRLSKYGYYKHIGPYNLIKQVGQKMRQELSTSGYQILFPYVEIYGHWTPDENKLETELIMRVE